MDVWGLTDPGNVREQNQDSFHTEFLRDDCLLAVVCDGMGGARSGNVASRLATDVFTEEVKRSFSPDKTPEETERVLRNAATLANISVFEHAQLSEEFSGMGTTLVACLIYPRAILVINIGDSRAYRFSTDGVE
ncbi:MAG: serine/threonine-protein phosphatase, partial [Clostridiales bacterium]|nr:serine/threonine-protein phosphatase [Clostridiales bacterium]